MKKNLSKLSLGFFLILLLISSCQKDEINDNLVLKAKSVSVNDPAIFEKITSFKTYEFTNLEKIDLQEFMNLEIQYGNDYNWKLSLTENLSSTENLESDVTTEEGTFKVEENSRHYKGTLFGNPESSVRVSFYDNKMTGFIFDGTETYQIIHLTTVSNLENYPNAMIIAKDSDFVPEEVTM
eukprot:TRINITY_DN40659_c0_g1_i1.p1 TRINITY_DN40659_c0_g1~~TRINITY_DN40659_c0_g1_i1.p1  ORF type:complete len:181 (-),score=5.51 TRINITY_DN40659_c0_g1_i1:184-726(-)